MCKIAAIKHLQCSFNMYMYRYGSKYADTMANSDDPNKTAALGLIWVCSLLEKSDLGLHCLDRPELLKVH